MKSLYSFPKDMAASIKNARVTIRDVSNMFLAQEVLQENLSNIMKTDDKGLADADHCVKLFPKVVAKLGDNSELMSKLKLKMDKISTELSGFFSNEDSENEEFFEVNLTDLSEEKIA